MYIKITETGPVDYSITNLRLDNPNVCFPQQPSDELLADFDVYQLYSLDQPTIDPNTQIVESTSRINLNGNWTQQWTIRNLTPEELQDRIPKVVSALQGMLAIKEAGLVPAFLAWKATLDPVIDFETLAFLEKAQTWVYDDLILNEALVALGIESQKDALFTLANTL